VKIKRYLENLLHQCSEEKTGQDAIDWAICSGFIKLTFDFDTDVKTCADEYSRIIEAYQCHLHRQAEHEWAEGLQQIAA